MSGYKRHRHGFLYHGVFGRQDNRGCFPTRCFNAGKNRAVRHSTILSTSRAVLMSKSWRNAIHTLAKLHRVDPGSVGLSDFGKPSGFYNRQIRTLGAISSAQAQAVDLETEKPVGNIPHFEEMVRFFSDSAMQPKDRSSLIHGDYKIDNLVYHKTEPRVIGILEYVSYDTELTSHC